MRLIRSSFVFVMPTESHALAQALNPTAERLRSRGVSVTLVFAEERIRDTIRFSDRRRELEAAGVSLCKLDTHAKLLVCDDWAVVTSFNFLSFEGYYDNDRRARHEFGIRVLDGTVADNLVELLGLVRP